MNQCRGGYSKLNLGGSRQFLPGRMQVWGFARTNRAEIFIHRAHSYSALSRTQRDLDRVYLFQSRNRILLRPSNWLLCFPGACVGVIGTTPLWLRAWAICLLVVFLPALSAFWSSLSARRVSYDTHSGLSLLGESYIKHRRRNQGGRGAPAPTKLYLGGHCPHKKLSYYLRTCALHSRGAPEHLAWNDERALYCLTFHGITMWM